jgi:H+/Cl- antiporter ClcA
MLIWQFLYGGGLNFVAKVTATGDETIGVVHYFTIPVLGAVGVALLNLSREFRLTFGDFHDEGIGIGTSDLNTYSDADSYSPRSPLRSIRKALAATVTLGTGSSLGPKGPGVEIGVAISRLWMYVWDSLSAASATANYLRLHLHQ